MHTETYHVIDSKILNIYNEVFESIEECNDDIIKTHIDKLKELDQFLLPSQSFFILANTINNSYEFVSNNFEKVLGLSKTKMLTEGLPYWLGNHHPKDLNIWLKMLKELMEFTMNEVSFEDRIKLSYTWNVRVKNSQGVYVNIYKHLSPLFFDQQGKPIIGLSHSTVTNELVTLPMIATVKILNNQNEYETIYHKNYSNLCITDGLSNRENDVIRLLALGKTSKEIGQALYISPHTVDGHRRKILEKLGLQSTKEIIAYAKHQLLF